MKRRVIVKVGTPFTDKILRSGTWVAPDGCTKIELFIVGGGGAGGGNGHGSGGGGGGGQVVVTNTSVVPGQRYSVTVGYGGVNGLNGNNYMYDDGGNGGDSAFDTIIAKGGNGGKGSKGHQQGLGGANYTKGGDGGRPSDRGLIIASPGVNGTFYDGDYYGSSGGAGGANGGRGMEASMPGGINAGHGYSMYEHQKDKNYPLIKSNSGCGGGSSWLGAFTGTGIDIRNSSNGAYGIVIIKGLKK